jgi:hypothetical protein
MDYLGRVTTRRCVVFLVSDFLGSDFDAFCLRRILLSSDLSMV